MRVHRLAMSAFGPFPGTEEIDFDPLNDAGVFLLTGQTGAGKTSILDAICFGLFGSVPGDRNNAKDLRSHHAEERAVPVVELEVTLRGRRFRLRRSPAWSRPSSRARSGVVEEHAQARMSELVDGEWLSLSTRVDEVGHLVTRTIGMSRDQFCQVVMLPQGQFQTFLKAGAKERHDVLEALFQTGRFLRIEKWLGEQRRLSERAYAAHESSLRELLARLEEVIEGAATVLDPAVATPSWTEQVVAVEAVAARTATLLFGAREREAAAHADAKSATHAYDEARAVVDRQARYAEAVGVIAALDATADVLTAREEVVARARAAAALQPLISRLEATTTARDAAQATVLESAERLRALEVEIPDLGPESIAAMVGEQHDRVQLLRSTAELNRQSVGLRSELRAIEAEVAAAETAAAAIEAALAALPQQVEAARTELAHAVEIARGVEALTAELSRRESALAAARRADRLWAEVSTAHDAAVAARDVALGRREQWLDLRERYLVSLAAVLAGELAEGVACPVCGSADHPHPALPDAGHATADAEQSALTALHQAEGTAADARERHEACIEQHRLAARDASGLTIDEAAAAVAVAGDDLARATAAASDSDALRALVATATAELAQLGTRSTEVTAEVAAGRARSAERGDALSRVLAQIHAVVGDREIEDCAEEARRRHAEALALQRAERSAHDHESAAIALRAQLLDALQESPFDTAAEATAARLSSTELANAEALTRQAVDQRAAAEHTAADPVLRAAADLPVPALAALASAVEDAQAVLLVESSAASRLGERLQRLESLGAEFADAVERTEPLRSQRDLTAGMAALAAGTSADNQTRTRLSHYVLSARLGQVVDAANLRLAAISAGRYQLQHSMRRGVGDARGGLGLLVLDTYTGMTRDPATLSGGETFYVSLALALGLADLVRDEIGGVELSTLFVDEGFGSLDAETLDEVMDELDSLRSGGRAVGIVSHLAELRQRIPTRVHVAAGHTGSRVLAD